jgi:hypothetical protein
VKALNELHAKLGECGQLGRGLHALGDDVATGLAGVAEQGGDQRPAVRITIDPPDQ